MRTDPRILAFIATEDWFFASHFLPLVEAGRAAGYDVVVIARERDHKAVIEAKGARFVAFEAERGTLNPFHVLTSLIRLKTLLGHIKPDIVHCIALRSIILGGLAARLAGIGVQIHAVTGLGFLKARKSFLSSLGLMLTRLFFKGMKARNTYYVFENMDDPDTLGLSSDQRKCMIILGGAGIDPDQLTPSSLPDLPPLKIAFVSRMLWSKGPDLAVRAVNLARAKGVNVTLSLFGSPDDSNPKAIPEHLLRDWSLNPCITWHGRGENMQELWSRHHLCILPSRGGEGLPRVLLEAAACGRGILTTDVAGCRTFVRDGLEGFVVPSNDAVRISDILIKLADDPARIRRLGENARQRVINEFTIDDVKNAMIVFYKKLT